MDRIIGGIYVGSLNALLLSGSRLKKSNNITHILSIMNGDMPINAEIESYTWKHIDELDEESTNLIQYFTETNEFIESALYPAVNDDQIISGGSNLETQKNADSDKKSTAHRGAILIHCIAGVSRSVTITAAYLMWKYKLTADQAVSVIKKRRPVAGPNPSFLEQLEIYEKTGYDASPANLIYRQWLLKRLIFKKDSNDLDFLKKVDFQPTVPTETDLVTGQFIKPRSQSQSVSKSNNDTKKKFVEARCKKCRNIIATTKSFIPHTPPAEGTKQSKFVRHTPGFKRMVSRVEEVDPNAQCTHYFLEPIIWMKDELSKGQLDGKFNCSKCSTKIGGYSWQGSRCSCGIWVNPALHIHKSKIDEVVQYTKL